MQEALPADKDAKSSAMSTPKYDGQEQNFTPKSMQINDADFMQQTPSESIQSFTGNQRMDPMANS